MNDDFGAWKQQVFKPFADENTSEHAAILDRLDKLNGFHNMILGAGAIIGFCTPAGIAIWAIIAATR
jgi:hypothetical protein